MFYILLIINKKKIDFTIIKDINFTNLYFYLIIGKDLSVIFNNIIKK